MNAELQIKRPGSLLLLTDYAHAFTAAMSIGGRTVAVGALLVQEGKPRMKARTADGDVEFDLGGSSFYLSPAEAEQVSRTFGFPILANLKQPTTTVQS